MTVRVVVADAERCVWRRNGATELIVTISVWQMRRAVEGVAAAGRLPVLLVGMVHVTEQRRVAVVRRIVVRVRREVPGLVALSSRRPSILVLR